MQNNLWEQDKELGKKTLRILVLSDYHMEEGQAERIKAWYLEQKEFDYDLVIIGGDFDNLQVYEKGHNHPEYSLSEARISTFLNHLEFFGTTVLYVPGNHDPATLFFKSTEEDESQKLTPFSINLHKSKMQIGHKLNIIGLGGSCPAEELHKKENKKNAVWVGFPYATDDESEFDLELLQDLVESIPEDESILLLTHNGPYTSGTTLFCR